MRLKKQFLHLYCNSDKKGFLTRNKIEITAMAFNDFSDRGKPDSMIRGCALSGEECLESIDRYERRCRQQRGGHPLQE